MVAAISGIYLPRVAQEFTSGPWLIQLSLQYKALQ